MDVNVKNARHVLVTGGAGYIGSHACKALVAAGFVPVVLDNLVYGHREAVKWGPLIVGDILDRRLVNELLVKYNPIGVLHFAAYAYVGESMSDPAKYYKNNVMGSLSLLEAICEYGVKFFVFSSTCATYGNVDADYITEDIPQNPVNPYGSSKLMVERILKDYDYAFGIKSVSLRYFNAAGADFQSELGESHFPETHLIPLIIDAATGLRDEIDVFGRDYDTPDGTCIRDFIHVSDLATAHVEALQHLINGGCTIQCNLGTGIGYSVLDVIQKVEEITGSDINVRFNARRPGDVPKLIAQVSKAKNYLNWNPIHSSLDDIVSTALSWSKNRSY
jgi:UDP-arabinose 4-epimerase